MTTGVPSRSCDFSTDNAPADTRRQPADAAVPMEDGALVPWIAS